MKFQTNYDGKSTGPETLSSKEMFVDALGYRSIKEQVESFLLAGLHLEAYRSGYYTSDLNPENLPHEDLMPDPFLQKSLHDGMEVWEIQDFARDVHSELLDKHHKAMALQQQALQEEAKTAKGAQAPEAVPPKAETPPAI